MSNKPDLVWVNGRILPVKEPAVSAESAGFKYGAGCFITLRVYNKRYLHFHTHLKRLEAGMAYLEIPPGKYPDSVQIKQAFHDLAEAMIIPENDIRARFQVSIGGIGNFSLTDEEEILMTASIGRISMVPDNYRIKSVNIPVIPSAVRPPHLKLCNNLHYMKAWRAAEKTGAQNALMFTTDRMVSEAATGNIFWKKGNTIFTPDSTCDILPGVMREICCKLITNNNEFLLQKGRYTFDDLTRAESVWITNSVIEIQPVSMIDSITYNTGDSVFEYLYQTLAEYKKLHLSA